MADAKVGAMEQQQVNALPIEEDEWHDLLPIEKKLMAYSLGLGVVLLFVFIFTFGVLK